MDALTRTPNGLAMATPIGTGIRRDLNRNDGRGVGMSGGAGVNR